MDDAHLIVVSVHLDALRPVSRSTSGGSLRSLRQRWLARPDLRLGGGLV